jgi:hypothetical protein
MRTTARVSLVVLDRSDDEARRVLIHALTHLEEAAGART